MSKRGSVIPAVGVFPLAVGVSRRWCGSILCQQKTYPDQLHWRRPPDGWQGRHLSWQLPELDPDHGHGIKLGTRVLVQPERTVAELAALLRNV
jgi:hypothetical protein